MKQPDHRAFSRAPIPSYITLPNLKPPLPSLLDFFDKRFPFVGRDVWRHRLEAGKISDESGNSVGINTPFKVNARLVYFREVTHEPSIPFNESVLFQNQSFLIADKPHFLPVTPSGNYVNECLLHRLIRTTGIHDLTPIHRLDRETAGLVLFSCSKQNRKAYFELFQQGNIYKSYEAIASPPYHPNQTVWQIESRIEQGEPRIRYRNTEGDINARSRIHLIERRGQLAKFKLVPITGKTHQLRLHLGLIGSHIVGDRLYPNFQSPDLISDYSNPLQLLAKRLSFYDPVSLETFSFNSRIKLNW